VFTVAHATAVLTHASSNFDAVGFEQAPRGSEVQVSDHRSSDPLTHPLDVAYLRDTERLSAWAPFRLNRGECFVDETKHSDRMKRSPLRTRSQPLVLHGVGPSLSRRVTAPSP